MGITAISRDWGIDPQIVRIVTTDNLDTIVANGYVTGQAANIAAIQNGVFQWRADDYVLISYSGGEGFFTYDAVNARFVQTGVLTAQVALTSAQILGMYATPVLVIPAPPANTSVLLNRIWGVYTFVTTQYQAGGAIGLEYGNAAHRAGPAASTTLAAATFNGYTASNTFELTPDSTDTLANIQGMPIYISNDTAAFTTGDGTLALTVNYQLVKTS